MILKQKQQNMVNEQRSLIYENVVNNIAKLIYELPLNNIHEKFYAFCYLLWNGYFSFNQTYGYSDIPPKDETCAIFLGSGCCRHNSDLLTSVLGKLDINSYSIFLRVLSTTIDSQMNIERKIIASNSETILTSLYNHKACIALDTLRESYFLLDPTGLTEAEIIEDGKLICYDGRYIVNKHLFKNDLNNIKCLDRMTIDKGQLRLYYEFAREVCLQSKQLFQDFYNDNHHYYEKSVALSLSPNKPVNKN